MLAFSQTRQFDPEPVVALAIETVPISEFQELVKGDEKAEKIQEQQAPEPSEQETTPVETEANAQIDAPKSAPEIAEKVDDQVEDLIENLPQANPQPEPEPEKQLTNEEIVQQKFAGLTVPKRAPKRPEPPKQKTAPVAAATKKPVVNRDNQTTKPKATGVEGSQVQKTAGSEKGSSVTLTASDKNNFIAQLKKCWRPPVFLQDKDLAVDILVDLNENGTLRQRPKVARNITHPEFVTMSGAAIRALERCQPYSLRAGTYEAWKRGLDITFRVDTIL